MKNGAGSGNGAWIRYENIIDTAPLGIYSNQNLNLNATNEIDITSNTANVDIVAQTDLNITANGIVLTGASLESNTSTGSAGKYLVITLNGVQYKIALENV